MKAALGEKLPPSVLTLLLGCIQGQAHENSAQWDSFKCPLLEILLLSVTVSSAPQGCCLSMWVQPLLMPPPSLGDTAWVHRGCCLLSLGASSQLRELAVGEVTSTLASEHSPFQCSGSGYQSCSSICALDFYFHKSWTCLFSAAQFM